MNIIRVLVRNAVESFPIDRDKKERLLKMLLRRQKERMRTSDES